jgi:DNA-binding MarR family transcriptional regulator
MIHLILVMSEQPTNATQMAQALHVTKGAVSQTISRLKKKGIIKKDKDPYLKNELTLMFTPTTQNQCDHPFSGFCLTFY